MSIDTTRKKPPSRGTTTPASSTQSHPRQQQQHGSNAESAIDLFYLNSDTDCGEGNTSPHLETLNTTTPQKQVQRSNIRGSPFDLWPSRSHDGHPTLLDESSFGIFANSFDSLSESGRLNLSSSSNPKDTFLDDESPNVRAQQFLHPRDGSILLDDHPHLDDDPHREHFPISTNTGPASTSSTPIRGSIGDIALPSLTHDPTVSLETGSLVDWSMSPIKLDYKKGGGLPTVAAAVPTLTEAGSIGTAIASMARNLAASDRPPPCRQQAASSIKPYALNLPDTPPPYFSDSTGATVQGYISSTKTYSSDQPYRHQPPYRTPQHQQRPVRQQQQPPADDYHPFQEYPDQEADLLINVGGDSLIRAVSNPFFVIRSARQAFENCKYILPCLRHAASESMSSNVHVSKYGHFRHYKAPEVRKKLDPEDLKVAIRRVETSICAFGGFILAKNLYPENSIFHGNGQINHRQVYNQRLPSRYYLSANRISWQVEEEPPIYIEPEDEGKVVLRSAANRNSKNHPCPESPEIGRAGDSCSDSSHDCDETPSPGHSSLTSNGAPSTDGSKMKYRCKLCGQLKQNHNCPYRQSLQRSIGVMVYPVVNSYTAAEPGKIAPPLTKMNNFVSYDSDAAISPEIKYPSFDTNARTTTPAAFKAVTPEALRSGTAANVHSPHSYGSAPSDDPNTMAGHGFNQDGKSSDIAINRKRTHTQMIDVGGQQRTLFAPAVVLRREHYRSVCRPTDSVTAYQYPAIPLTFAERKRLSDTLFCLSKEIPDMTGDCAALLRDAREVDEWDLAVAELLTQVIVGLYCGEGDGRLDGLQQYLLGIGISC